MAQAVLSGVSKVYAGGVAAVDALDLEVAEGELLVLVGPSGSGKTTVLRLIAGLEQPTAGSISIGGRRVNDVAARQRNVAMVFQSHAIYPHWSVYKNIAFGLQLRQPGGWRRRLLQRLPRSLWPAAIANQQVELHRQVTEAARLLGIEALLDRPASELSGGEEQRVALGRAMVRRPALFLLDEPLSNLDAQLRVQLRRDLKQLHRRLGATMIYVTHDQAEALALGDRIAVLNCGRIEQVASPRMLYERPVNRFVAGFVGTPPMNSFDAVRSGERCLLSTAGWSIEVSASWWRGEPDDAAKVGLRPEDIFLRRPAEPSPDGELPSARAIVALVDYQGESCLVSLAPENLQQSQKQASPEWPGAVLLGKALSSSGLQPGEPIIAWFDMRRAHWFDGQTGRNLHPTSVE